MAFGFSFPSSRVRAPCVSLSKGQIANGSEKTTRMGRRAGNGLWNAEPGMTRILASLLRISSVPNVPGDAANARFDAVSISGVVFSAAFPIYLVGEGLPPMKRQPPTEHPMNKKKLQLNKSTIRNLKDGALKQVAGGLISEVCTFREGCTTVSL